MNQLINNSKGLLIDVITVINTCDEILAVESRSRADQQPVYELKKAGVEFQHQILNFMGVEGTPEEPKLTKEVLLRANK